MKYRVVKNIKNIYTTSLVLDYKGWLLFKKGKKPFESIAVYDMWFGNSEKNTFLILDSEGYEEIEVILIPYSMYIGELVRQSIKLIKHPTKPVH